MQLPKGRKESRVRRVEEEPHWPFKAARSWEVKKAREVFLLPGEEGLDVTGGESGSWVLGDSEDTTYYAP